jgi:hypothetical protein
MIATATGMKIVTGTALATLAVTYTPVLAQIIPDASQLTALSTWEGDVVAGAIAGFALWMNYRLSISLTTDRAKEVERIVTQFASSVERFVTNNEHTQRQQAHGSELLQVLVDIIRSRPCLIHRGGAQDEKLEQAILKVKSAMDTDKGEQ